MSVNEFTFRLQQVAQQIPEGATVLDVGCSTGALLQHLRDNKNVDGRGIELNSDRVGIAVARGLSVVQGDAENDLVNFPDDSVDYAVLSETLQAMQRPDVILEELLRIGRRAIVAFPNFGHWRVRADLCLRGRMPVNDNLPQSWYETENIHFCTIADFKTLIVTQGHRVEEQLFLAGETPVRFWPNLRADHALFVLSR